MTVRMGDRVDAGSSPSDMETVAGRSEALATANATMGTETVVRMERMVEESRSSGDRAA